MFGADTQEVSVPGNHDHIQFWPGHFHSKRYGQRPAVYTMKAVGLGALQQVNQVARATDSRNHHVVLRRLTRFFQPVDHGHFQGPAHAKVSATGAPFEVVFRVLLAHARAISFWAVPTISFTWVTKYRTLKGRPVYWVIASAFTPMERRMLANCP